MATAQIYGRLAAVLEAACGREKVNAPVDQWHTWPRKMVEVLARQNVQAHLGPKSYLGRRVQTLLNDATEWPERFGADSGEYWLAFYREKGSIAAAGSLMARRQRLGMTQAQFAAALGVSKATIVAIEYAQRPADPALAEVASRLAPDDAGAGEEA